MQKDIEATMFALLHLKTQCGKEPKMSLQNFGFLGTYYNAL